MGPKRQNTEGPPSATKKAKQDPDAADPAAAGQSQNPPTAAAAPGGGDEPGGDPAHNEVTDPFGTYSNDTIRGGISTYQQFQREYAIQFRGLFNKMWIGTPTERSDCLKKLADAWYEFKRQNISAKSLCLKKIIDEGDDKKDSKGNVLSVATPEQKALAVEVKDSIEFKELAWVQEMEKLIRGGSTKHDMSVLDLDGAGGPGAEPPKRANRAQPPNPAAPAAAAEPRPDETFASKFERTMKKFQALFKKHGECYKTKDCRAEGLPAMLMLERRADAYRKRQAEIAARATAGNIEQITLQMENVTRELRVLDVQIRTQNDARDTVSANIRQATELLKDVNNRRTVLHNRMVEAGKAGATTGTTPEEIRDRINKKTEELNLLLQTIPLDVEINRLTNELETLKAQEEALDDNIRELLASRREAYKQLQGLVDQAAKVGTPADLDELRTKFPDAGL